MKWEVIREDIYAQVSHIYLEGIATGMATFQEDAPSWEVWNENHLNFGRIALFEGPKMQGWAALSPVSKRFVYRGVAEVSIYVAADDRGKGLGQILMNALIQESEDQGVWTLQSSIFPENEASLALHQSCGFRIIGYRERIGQKNGIWKDNVLLERRRAKD